MDNNKKQKGAEIYIKRQLNIHTLLYVNLLILYINC